MHSKDCVRLYYSQQRDMVHGDVTFDDMTVAVELPYKALQDAYRAIRGIGSLDGTEELGGFFSFLKKATHIAAAIAKNPLVRAVVGVVPGGGTALSAVEVADMGAEALSAGVAAIKKKPDTHRIIAAARKGDLAAARSLRTLPHAARQKVRDAEVLQQHALELHRNLAMLKSVVDSSGYPPALTRALSHRSAPWR